MMTVSNRWRIFSFAVGCIMLCSCGSDGQSVELPNGIAVTDVLSVDLYAPFDRRTLLNEAEDAYGEPRDVGFEESGDYSLYYIEYVGKHGRIRVYDETYPMDEGWVSTQWLEVYPGKLYLKDIIKNNYLTGVTPGEQKWTLTLHSPDDSWFLSLDLDKKAVTRISDHPR